MSKFVVSVKVEAVVQVEVTGNSESEAKRAALDEVAKTYPRADRRVLSIDAGGEA